MKTFSQWINEANLPYGQRLPRGLQIAPTEDRIGSLEIETHELNIQVNILNRRVNALENEQKNKNNWFWQKR